MSPPRPCWSAAGAVEASWPPPGLQLPRCGRCTPGCRRQKSPSCSRGRPPATPPRMPRAAVPPRRRCRRRRRVPLCCGSRAGRLRRAGRLPLIAGRPRSSLRSRALASAGPRKRTTRAPAPASAAAETRGRPRGSTRSSEAWRSRCSASRRAAHEGPQTLRCPRARVRAHCATCGIAAQGLRIVNHFCTSRVRLPRLHTPVEPLRVVEGQGTSPPCRVAHSSNS